ncbi:MAG: SOS response-associated peptidase [Comamonadaceae bacterium]|nr:MAG: SOS response-associated peptidase [Comamonadaceae bacterium]
MCSNYVSVSSEERLLHFFGVRRADPKQPPEIWPTGLAPFIRKVDGRRVAETGHYGLLPSFATEVTYGRRTYNARSETVHQLASFRESWRKGWRCVIPAEALFEPYYPPEGGKPVRWAITRPGRVPMGVAGIYREWRSPEGELKFSFAMLTVNADAHPFYSRFHKPGDEKRMPIVLREDQYDAWLACEVADAPAFFVTHPGPFDAEPAPLPPRAPRAVSGRTVIPPAAPPEEPGLF